MSKRKENRYEIHDAEDKASVDYLTVMAKMMKAIEEEDDLPEEFKAYHFLHLKNVVAFFDFARPKRSWQGSCALAEVMWGEH